MEVGDRAGPVGVNVRHVHPGHKGPGKGVEQAFFGLVDFGDAEDVVDVGDDGEAFVGDEIGGCVAGVGALGVDVEALDGGVGAVAGGEAVAVYGDEDVDVALVGGWDGDDDLLVAALRGYGPSSAGLAR